MLSFNQAHQEIGDIILVYNKSSKSNVVSQSALTGGKARFSHAIIGLSPGTYIEAMNHEKNTNKLDIDIFCIDSLKKRFSDEYTDTWKVIRYNNLTLDNWGDIIERGMYYYGQKYNKHFATRFFKNRRTNSSYCSELVTKIYEDIGITIKEKRDVWPIHLDELTDLEEWDDVTDQYKKDQSENYNNDHDIKFCKIIKHYNTLLLTFNLTQKKHSDEWKKIIKTFNKKASSPRQFVESEEFKELYQGFGGPTFYNTFIYLFTVDINKKHGTNKVKYSWVNELIVEEKFDVKFNIQDVVTNIIMFEDIFNNIKSVFFEYREWLAKYKKNDKDIFSLCKKLEKALSTMIPTDYEDTDLTTSYESITNIDDTYESEFGVKSKLYFIIENYQMFKAVKPLLTKKTYDKSTCSELIKEIDNILCDKDLLINKKY